jgi:hypothetical protein
VDDQAGDSIHYVTREIVEVAASALCSPTVTIITWPTPPTIN